MVGIDKMLERLNIGYIDLLLLHQQVGDYMGAWKDMGKAVAQGKVKAIGLSNFESERLEEVCETATIKPAVLQVECHPYYQQEALKKRLAPYGTFRKETSSFRSQQTRSISRITLISLILH